VTSTKHSTSKAQTCPVCGSQLKRVRRSLLDRLISLFVPMERVRCASKVCSWEGRVHRGALGRFSRGHRKYYRSGAVEASRGAVAAEMPRHEPAPGRTPGAMAPVADGQRRANERASLATHE
jgi:hypothetical protein